MNDLPLPDDVSRWPRDPYTLLGVSLDTPLREVKKAYAQLLRRFRPEESPEQFRRIRDAFEAIQYYAKFSAPHPLPLESAEETAPAPADDQSPSPSEIPAEPDFEPAASAVNPLTVPVPAPAAKQDELAQLWEKACTGGEAVAYRRMREIYEGDPREIDVLLRLYWLL